MQKSQQKGFDTKMLGKVVGNIPASEMTVVGEDLNGHVDATVGQCFFLLTKSKMKITITKLKQ